MHLRAGTGRAAPGRVLRSVPGARLIASSPVAAGRTCDEGLSRGLRLSNGSASLRQRGREGGIAGRSRCGHPRRTRNG